jgi:UDP-glucose 4-epimerase
MARLLVTGGAGYVGSHALRALRAAGHEAVVIDDLRSGRSEFAAGAELVRADVGNADAVADVLARLGPFEGVLHFAASIEVAESVARPLAFHRNNVSASLTLLEASVAAGVRAFVFSSSAAVYGNPERVPIPEDARLAPVSPYGAGKAMVERMLADAGAAHGLRTAALRYFNAAGADPDVEIGESHSPEIHLIPRAIEAATGGPGLLVFGDDYPTPDGTCLRDYIHVADLADAHVKALEAIADTGVSTVYNLGTGHPHSVREIIEAVERVSGRRVPWSLAPRRPGDPAVLYAAAHKAQRELRWTPRFADIDTIVRTAWAWHQRPHGTVPTTP